MDGVAVKVEYKYIEAEAHIGQQVFEFKVAHFVQCGQKNWAFELDAFKFGVFLIILLF